MELKAIYRKKTDCRSCMDLGWADITYCAECVRMCTEEVDILSLGVGMLGNKAVIKKKSGELKTVLVSELKIQ